MAMNVRVLDEIEEGVEVGAHPCACGGCRPVATIFRDDPRYDHHDPDLAQGPCCCGRFFVVGPEAETRAQTMAGDLVGPDAYRFERTTLELPWGESVPVVIAEFRE